MAFTPRRNKFDVSIPVFDGGLNTKFEEVAMPLNQSPKLQNVEFDDLGSVGTSKGYKQIVTSIASAPVNGIHSYVNTKGDRRLLCVCGGTPYILTPGSAATIASGQSIYATDRDVDMITVEDYVVFNNGDVNAYKFDDNKFFRFGIPVLQSGTASLASGATGTLTGSYDYAISGLNFNNVEGDIFQINSQSVSVTSGQIDLSGIPEFPTSHGVGEKYLYRTTAGVSNIFWRVTSITNAATTYTDNNSDSTLVTSSPDDNGAPPKVKWMLEHRNRVFGFGNEDFPERLYYSNQGSPEIWPSTNYTDIGKGDGEPITGARIYGNSLFVMKNDGRGQGSVWLVNMPDSLDVTGTSNWYVEKLNIEYGAISHKAMDFYSNLMFFVNRLGAFAIAGKNLALNPAAGEVGQFPVDSLSFLIEPDALNWRDDLLRNAAAINYKNRMWLSVPSSEQSTKNDRVYIFDYQRASSQQQQTGAWSYNNDPAVNNFTIHEGELYAGSAEDDGHVYKLDSGYKLEGNATTSVIDSYFWTAPITGRQEHRDNHKIYRHVMLLAECTGDYTMTIGYVNDFKDEDTITEQSINLTGGGSIWGGGGDGQVSNPV